MCIDHKKFIKNVINSTSFQIPQNGRSYVVPVVQGLLQGARSWSHRCRQLLFGNLVYTLALQMDDSWCHFLVWPSLS